VLKNFVAGLLKRVKGEADLHARARENVIENSERTRTTNTDLSGSGKRIEAYESFQQPT
jgi:hypothetical protein